MPVDYSISARQRVLDEIIDSELQAELYNNTIDLKVPSVANQDSRNTRLQVEVFDDGTMINSFVIYYNRLELSAVLTPLDAVLLDISTVTTTHDVLPLLLAEHDVNLLPEDIVLDTLANTSNTIAATATSYGWTGTFAFNAVTLDFPLLFRTRDSRLPVSRSGLFLIPRILPNLH